MRRARRLHVAAIWDGELGEVGQILQGSGQPDAEIDVTCPLGRGQQASWVLGECNWQTRPQGASSLRQLQSNAEALPGAGVDLIDLPALYHPS